MSSLYPGIQWVVQRNLTSKTDLESLQLSCEAAGVSFQGIDIIPFSSSLTVECGCMNAAGFYKADVGAIVAAVSAWFVNVSQ
ncbi:hypothetical protein [Chitinophaga sp. RAB17]|uniref:hypothetical protein n=1 Tax=Chitinophaga sp. RAB17 TaxID=3233049 RepID=UPI003F8E1B33